MNEILEETTSPDGRWKTEIRQRLDGTFQVHLLRWIDEDVPDYGRVASLWSEVRTAVSITDDMRVARSIAAELLMTHAQQGKSIRSE